MSVRPGPPAPSDRRRLRWFRPLPVVAVLVAFGVGPACSGSDGDDAAGPDGAAPATAPSVLAAAAARWAGTDSAHFELEAEGDTFLDEGRRLRLVSASGHVARPDAARATARVVAGPAQVSVEIVVIGADAYLTNFITGKWDRAPDDFGYNPALLFDPGRGLGAVLPSLDAATLAGEERVDDRPARRVRGTVSGERISEVTAGTIDGERIEVEVWVARDDSDLLRVTLDAPADAPAAGSAPSGAGGDGQGGGRWDLRFSRQGEDVEITAPM